MTGDVIRVATWNIRAAANSKLAPIAEAASALDTDVLVLTEVTPHQHALVELLSRLGWRLASSSNPTGTYRGVSVFCRDDSEPVEIADPCHPWSGLAAVRYRGLTVIGAYAPGGDSFVDARRVKKAWWEGLHQVADQFRHMPAVITGDLNSGVQGEDEWQRTFTFASLFEELSEHGFRDGWRHRHGPQARAASWWSSVGNPFRLDHVHVTASVEVVEADYVRRVDHHRYVAVPGGGTPALSDHAALVSTLRIQPIDK